MARAPLVILLAIASCGRLGFDAIDDASTSGHDEDGDGFIDDTDDCPHLPGPQRDSDGDGVGDACDPQPASARQTRAVFATMQPGDQPFMLATLGTGAFTQAADGLILTGSFAEMTLPIAVEEFSLQIGFRIDAVTGSENDQHQFAIGPEPQLPSFSAELNEVGPSFSFAALTVYDGSVFDQVNAVPLAMGIHTGEATLKMTAFVGDLPFINVETGWAGEPYAFGSSADGYTGGTQITVNINNLDLEIHYIWVVTTN